MDNKTAYRGKVTRFPKYFPLQQMPGVLEIPGSLDISPIITEFFRRKKRQSLRQYYLKQHLKQFYHIHLSTTAGWTTITRDIYTRKFSGSRIQY